MPPARTSDSSMFGSTTTTLPLMRTGWPEASVATPCRLVAEAVPAHAIKANSSKARGRLERRLILGLLGRPGTDGPGAAGGGHATILGISGAVSLRAFPQIQPRFLRCPNSPAGWA